MNVKEGCYGKFIEHDWSCETPLGMDYNGLACLQQQTLKVDTRNNMLCCAI